MPFLSESFGINPYSPNVTFLYLQKTSENLRFSDVFRGYRNVTLGEYELKRLKAKMRFITHNNTPQIIID